ncbi:MAG: dTMP kinase [Lautropia sp.]
MTGRFVTFEGIDGAGKSTHLAACADWLRGAGRRVVVSREPGGTALAEAIRDCFLAHPSDPRTEALLAFAARSDHLARVIRPALADGAWVICDRFTDSTVAYQGAGRGLGAAAIEQLEAWLHPDLRPDRTYLFDLEPREAARRRAAARAADRFEAEDVAFFARVRDGYLARARRDPDRFALIDASGEAAAIGAAVLADLAACSRRWSER